MDGRITRIRTLLMRACGRFNHKSDPLQPPMLKETGGTDWVIDVQPPGYYLLVKVLKEV